jgi:hypothetical protein
MYLTEVLDNYQHEATKSLYYKILFHFLVSNLLTVTILANKYKLDCYYPSKYKFDLLSKHTNPNLTVTIQAKKNKNLLCTGWGY